MDKLLTNAIKKERSFLILSLIPKIFDLTKSFSKVQ